MSCTGCQFATPAAAVDGSSIETSMARMGRLVVLLRGARMETRTNAAVVKPSFAAPLEALAQSVETVPPRP